MTDMSGLRNRVGSSGSHLYPLVELRTWAVPHLSAAMRRSDPIDISTFEDSKLTGFSTISPLMHSMPASSSIRRSSSGEISRAVWVISRIDMALTPPFVGRPLYLIHPSPPPQTPPAPPSRSPSTAQTRPPLHQSAPAQA